jgi:hypothetical protein
MAKKSRKPNLPQETLARARRELYGTAQPAKQESAPAPTADAAPQAAPKRKPAYVPRKVDLREEYAYVITDLRNMAVLAAGLMVVLVVMSFFI